MLMNIVYGFVGLGIGYYLKGMLTSRIMGIKTIETAVKKKQFLVFLETPTGTILRRIVLLDQNIGITENKEVVIIPAGTVKPCAQLRGINIAHGDLYRAVTVPGDIIKLKDELVKNGWTTDKVGSFFKLIEETPQATIKKKLDAIDIEKINGDEFKPYNVYISMSSVVKDFVYTGLNRTSIHEMLRNLVAKRELDNLNKKDWVTIAIAVTIVLVGLGVLFKFIAPAIATMGASSAPAVPPARLG